MDFVLARIFGDSLAFYVTSIFLQPFRVYILLYNPNAFHSLALPQLQPQKQRNISCLILSTVENWISKSKHDSAGHSN